MSGGMAPECIPISDDVIGSHGPVRAFATDIHSDSDSVLEAGIIPDDFRDTVGLVSGQGIHRIENDRLDAGFTDLAVAMIEDRIKEAFRLTRTRSSGDEGRYRSVVPFTTQKLEG